jgi:hypothetical protein
MLSAVKNLLPAGIAKTFSTYAPGLSNNYTSKEDVMKRDNIMVTYTGKDDMKKLGKFKYYANMTHQYVCLDYTAVCDWVTVQEFDLDNGEIPVCYKFQADWNEVSHALFGAQYTHTFAVLFARAQTSCPITNLSHSIADRDQVSWLLPYVQWRASERY